MDEAKKKQFHKIFGKQNTRITYKRTDFNDYVLMSLATAAVLYFIYGSTNIVTVIGVALCIFMPISFVVRHGVSLRFPVTLKRPQDVIYVIVYKLLNLKIGYFLAVVLLLLENYIIKITPDWPHYLNFTNQAVLYLFYLHLALISLYRTYILFAHLKERNHVRAVLMDTVWANHLKQQPNITFEIIHAYITGLLTHVVLVAPWFFVITHLNFSLVLLPIVCVLNILIFLRTLKDYNAWFYRDHWLGHNSEVDFLYLHGTHHDAIPSGLIGVSGNGFLEGFFRHAMGGPTPFFNPIITFMLYTMDVKNDIDFHQYIPGVFPKLTREFNEIQQHSIHHFGKLKPYGFGLNFDKPDLSEDIQKQFKIFPDSLKQSAKLDEELNGFQWDNSKHKWYLELFDKYNK